MLVPIIKKEYYKSMLKSTIIIAIILLIIYVFGVLYLTNLDSPKKKMGATSTTKKILLYTENVDVTFKVPGSQTFQRATSSPIAIPNQTTVHTKTGKVSVLLPDNSIISLDKNTEITISQSGKDTSIYQTLGLSYHRVEKLISGSSYQVKTPGTLAAVRGTKFAINYDEEKKKTKVSVTESKVQVSTIPKTTGTSTAPLPPVETVIIEEGKTVSVDTVVDAKIGAPSAMKVVETEKDKEMQVWTNTNKEDDIKLENIKKEIEKENQDNKKESENGVEKVESKEADKEEARKEIKRVLFDDTTSDKIEKEELKEEPKDESVLEKIKNILIDTLNPETNNDEATTTEKKDGISDEIKNGTTTEEIKTETKEDTTQTAQPDTLVNQETNNITPNTNTISGGGGSYSSGGTTLNSTPPETKKTTPIISIRTLGEEEFFDIFNNMFSKYFYVDETDSTCLLKITPEERVRVVKSYAINSGYPIGTDLLPFAQAIDSYCNKKDNATKIKLQNRFDDDFPFKENL